MDTKDQIVKELDTMSDWKIPFLFGALKNPITLRYYLWTSKEIQEVNEFYHTELEKYNGFPIKKLDLFRPKNDKVFINSFFKDIKGQPFFLRKVILNIKHNLDLLLGVIKICHSVYDSNDVKIFYEEVENYFENQKGLVRPGYSYYTKPIAFNYLIKDVKFAQTLIEKIEKKENVFEEYMVDEYDFSHRYKDYLSDFDRDKKVVLTSLTPEALKVLNNDLEGIEEIDQKTCLNLLANYEEFVHPDYQDRFTSKVLKYENFKYAVVKFVTAEVFAPIIKKYFNKVYFLSRRNNMTDNEYLMVKKEFHKRIKDLEYGEEFLYYVEILSYFTKKKYQFLDDEGFCWINHIMRFLVPSSAPDWYCYDPKWNGEWFKYYESDLKKYDDDIVMCFYCIICNHVIVSSSLILETFDILKKYPNFNDAKKRINSLVRKHNSDLKSGKVLF